MIALAYRRPTPEEIAAAVALLDRAAREVPAAAELLDDVLLAALREDVAPRLAAHFPRRRARSLAQALAVVARESDELVAEEAAAVESFRDAVASRLAEPDLGPFARLLAEARAAVVALSRAQPPAAWGVLRAAP